MQTIRTVLADDHAVVRAGIRRTAEEIPHLNIIAEVDTGPLVFNILENTAVDLLLIDVSMPDFDPIQAIREIKNLYPTLKILVISAYNDEFYVKGLLNAGVNGYHMKDQSLSDLKLAITRILDGETWISHSLIEILSLDNSEEDKLPKLTIRQRDLLISLRHGLDNKTIAKEHSLSVKTIENNLSALYRKLNVQSRLEAVNYSIRNPEIIGAVEGWKNYRTNSIQTTQKSCNNILVIDDNTRYRSQMINMLNNIDSKAKVFDANGIESALTIVRKIEFQIVFVDVILNEESGIQCTKQIREIQPNARIILISAYPDQEFHKEGIKAGAVAFLDKKDLGLATLRQIIDDIKE
jgi:DNA-binding NarL/FixJ family response regulator